MSLNGLLFMTSAWLIYLIFVNFEKANRELSDSNTHLQIGIDIHIGVVWGWFLYDNQAVFWPLHPPKVIFKIDLYTDYAVIA